MARGAAHVLVSAPQREGRPFLVIKERGLPLCAVVALSAVRYVSHGKLLPVDVFMAVFADSRCRFEVDIDQLGFEIRRLVAVLAGRCAVSSQQREFCSRVIKTRHLIP